MLLQIPVAWLLLTREKMRLLIALAGVAFAVILMFMQFGFQSALFDSSVVFHQKLRGDLFLISPQSISLVGLRQFSSRRLYQSLGAEGVKSVSPIYADFALWKNPVNKKTRSIFAVGIKPYDDVLDLPGVTQNRDKLKLRDCVLFDELSRLEFGPIAEQCKEGLIPKADVGHKKVEVVGLFKLGPSFGGDGTIITSDLTFLRLGLFRQRSAGLIDLGSITLSKGANLQKVQQDLKSRLPKDVKVLSKAEFIAFEKKYWQDSTAIGFIFSLGAILGFVVGSVIVYQILYSDVFEHLSEYATLKAIGYSDTSLLTFVFQEALILSVIGFVPGLCLSYVLYEAAHLATSLPMILTVDRAVFILALTIIMCLVSAFIATNKLREADPADVF